MCVRSGELDMHSHAERGNENNAGDHFLDVTKMIDPAPQSWRINDRVRTIFPGSGKWSKSVIMTRQRPVMVSRTALTIGYGIGIAAK